MSFVLELPGFAPAAVGIFDVRGRRVRSLSTRGADRGPRTIVWDGRDDAGRSTVPGVYFLRVRAFGREVSRAVVRR